MEKANFIPEAEYLSILKDSNSSQKVLAINEIDMERLPDRDNCVSAWEGDTAWFCYHDSIWPIASRTPALWEHCSTVVFLHNDRAFKIVENSYKVICSSSTVIMLWSLILVLASAWIQWQSAVEFNVFTVSLYLQLDMLHLFCSCQASHVICLINIYKCKLINWIHLEMKYGAVIYNVAFVYGYN